jgi:hypothetical protein
MAHVNLLGIDDFGRTVGLNPLWGLAIGGGASAAGYIGSKFIPSVADKALYIGLGLAALSGGVLYAMGPDTHGAGAGAVLGGLLAVGVGAIENKLTKGSFMGAFGVPVVNQLGLPQVNYLNGGLGVATVIPTPSSYGTVPGVAGVAQSAALGPPINLLGGGSALGMQAQMLAGPTLQAPHGLASAYGANLFSAH